MRYIRTALRTQARRHKSGNARPRQSGKKEEAESGLFSGIVLKTIIGILLTSLFGDFIVKRTIQNYIEEKNSFDNAPAVSHDAFKIHNDVYNRLLKPRRSKSQQLFKYINDKEFVKFLDRYSAYDLDVQNWNDNLSNMAKTIINITKCKEKFETNIPINREKVFNRIILTMSNANRDIVDLLKIEPNLISELKESFFKYKWFCPTYFLTKIDSNYSVHSVFRKLHKKLYSFGQHDYSQCIVRQKNLFDDYIRICVSENGIKSASLCNRSVTENVATGEFCSHIQFSKRKFMATRIDFARFDLFWGIGNHLFLESKRAFMVSECKKRLVSGDTFYVTIAYRKSMNS